MTFCFVTDHVSPHELPLAMRLAEIVGLEKFNYIVSEAMEVQRTALGWAGEVHPWCRVIGGDEGNKAAAWDLIQDADVAVFGNRAHPLLKERVQRGKLSFYGSERWFKPPLGKWRYLHPPFHIMARSFKQFFRAPAFFYLAQGIYAARDMRDICSNPKKILQFGYVVEPSQPLPLPRRRDGPLQVLWAGRMLALKRVDTLIRAMEHLTRQACEVRLTLVGDGPEADAMKKRVAASKAAASIRFEQPVPIGAVRERMRCADVYVLASNGYEGWGVVVNEAMLEGCAVVASRESGAGATLIRDGETGLLFPAGDVRALAGALARLDTDEELRQRIAVSGQRLMLAEWTPAVVAERLVVFSDAFLSGRDLPHWASGPFSHA